VVTDVLVRAGVDAADVDTVFATGGSALVPAVRERWPASAKKNSQAATS
jgi:hypothetical protein